MAGMMTVEEMVRGESKNIEFKVSLPKESVPLPTHRVAGLLLA